MRHYVVKLNAEVPYPKVWTKRVEASNHATAASRAIKDWRRNDVRGRRIKTVGLKVHQLETT